MMALRYGPFCAIGSITKAVSPDFFLLNVVPYFISSTKKCVCVF